MSLCPLCHVLPTVIKLHFLTGGTGGGRVPTLWRGTSTVLVKKWIQIGALKKPHRHKVSQLEHVPSNILRNLFKLCIWTLTHSVCEALDKEAQRWSAGLACESEWWHVPNQLRPPQLSELASKHSGVYIWVHMLSHFHLLWIRWQKIKVDISFSFSFSLSHFICLPIAFSLFQIITRPGRWENKSRADIKVALS